jgi:hypothetical protein
MRTSAAASALRGVTRARSSWRPVVPMSVCLSRLGVRYGLIRSVRRGAGRCSGVGQANAQSRCRTPLPTTAIRSSSGCSDPRRGVAEQPGYQSAMEGGQRRPHAMAEAPVMVQEGPQRHSPIGCLHKEVAGQKPGRSLEPDPIFATVADLPSGHGRRRSSSAESETEETAPDQQLRDAGDVAKHRPSPLLRCRVGVGGEGELIGVVDVRQRAERANGLGDVVHPHGAVNKADAHLAVPVPVYDAVQDQARPYIRWRI